MSIARPTPAALLAAPTAVTPQTGGGPSLHAISGLQVGQASQEEREKQGPQIDLEEEQGM